MNTFEDYSEGVDGRLVERDRAEWPLTEPDRSDDREQVIYEGHRGASCQKKERTA